MGHRGGARILVAVRHDDNVAGPEVDDGTRHCIYGVVEGGPPSEHRGGGFEAGEPSGRGLAVAVDGVVEAGAHAAGEGREGDLRREALSFEALDVGVDGLAGFPYLGEHGAAGVEQDVVVMGCGGVESRAGGGGHVAIGSHLECSFQERWG